MTYRSAGATFTREVFSSAPDQVLVIQLTCDKPGRISFSATLTRERMRPCGSGAVGRKGNAGSASSGRGRRKDFASASRTGDCRHHRR
ncbi:MAG: glycoside hydrolase N-terminal domain-containing protein [Bryobacteraceae bacterium]